MKDQVLLRALFTLYYHKAFRKCRPALLIPLRSGIFTFRHSITDIPFKYLKLSFNSQVWYLSLHTTKEQNVICITCDVCE